MVGCDTFRQQLQATFDCPSSKHRTVDPATAGSSWPHLATARSLLLLPIGDRTVDPATAGRPRYATARSLLLLLIGDQTVER